MPVMRSAVPPWQERDGIPQTLLRPVQGARVYVQAEMGDAQAQPKIGLEMKQLPPRKASDGLTPSQSVLEAPTTSSKGRPAHGSSA